MSGGDEFTGRPDAAELEPGPGEDLTAVLDGRFFLIQPAKGARFSVDSILSAGFSRLRSGQEALDLGSGTGVTAILLALAFPQTRVTALELQPRLARLTWRNVFRCRLENRVRVIQGDLRRPATFPPNSFDAVVTNPPYRPLGTGRLGPEAERNVARHEIECTLADWTSAARRWLRPGGRLTAVYPAWRLPALVSALTDADLSLKRLRLVHPRPGGEAELVLVEARLGGGEELAVGPPFFIYAGPSGPDWSKEMAGLLSGRLLGAI